MNRLDLHGKRNHEVQELVEDWVLRNSIDECLPLKIICGNSAKMIQLVDEVLQKHDIPYRMWQYGVITVDDVGVQAGICS